MILTIKILNESNVILKENHKRNTLKIICNTNQMLLQIIKKNLDKIQLTLKISVKTTKISTQVQNHYKFDKSTKTCYENHNYLFEPSQRLSEQLLQ